MDKIQSALPADVFSPAPQGWYLLLDRTRGNPLSTEEEALAVPATASIPLDDAFFAHEPECAPLLVDLSVTPGLTAEQKQHWALLGLDGIRQSLIQGGNAMVAGWLYSEHPAEQVKNHLRRLFAQPYCDGQIHHLRYYDPRISRLLDISLPAPQRNLLLGPIAAWWYPVYPGNYRCMKAAPPRPKESCLTLTPADWQTLDHAAPYHQLVRGLAGLHELYADHIPFDVLPDFDSICVLLQQAAALPWVENQDDMVGCALLWWLLGQDCCELYPDVAAALQQFQHDRAPTLTENLLFAGAEFWAKPIRSPATYTTRGAVA